ncbi:MAG: hypothetical protein QXI16_01060 [Sulfolobaceae archaeon]
MKILELFAGTRSIGKEFELKGHQVFSVEWDKKFEHIDLYTDIEFLTKETIISLFGIPDVIWASPDCTTYSVAGISHHRINKGDLHYYPISDYAKKSDRVNDNLWKLIKSFLEINPNLIYFVENPRGVYRKMYFVNEIPRYTVTYCQYGETRMKPTDLFTNHSDPKFKPPCKNGDSCHVSAPRGSQNGTQGLKTVDRSRIPSLLCKHIVEITEDLK